MDFRTKYMYSIICHDYSPETFQCNTTESSPIRSRPNYFHCFERLCEPWNDSVRGRGLEVITQHYMVTLPNVSCQGNVCVLLINRTNFESSAAELIIDLGADNDINELANKLSNELYKCTVKSKISNQAAENTNDKLGKMGETATG